MKKERFTRQKRKIARVLDIPQDAMVHMPKIRMMGDEELVVDGFSDILEYTKFKVRLKSNIGQITVNGKNLEIRELEKEDVYISGKISAVLIGDDE